jgi:hypothetical protein
MVALTAQSHKIVYGVQLLATAHSSGLNMMNVYRLFTAHLATYEIGYFVSHFSQINFDVVLHGLEI